MNKQNSLSKLTRDELGQLHGGFNLQSSIDVDTNFASKNVNCKGGGFLDSNVNCNRCSSCGKSSGPGGR